MADAADFPADYQRKVYTQAEAESLAARLAEVERDAARYRWLRERTTATGLDRWMGHHQFLDVAIDAVMGTADSAYANYCECAKPKPGPNPSLCVACGRVVRATGSADACPKCGAADHSECPCSPDEQWEAASSASDAKGGC